ncbi:MAG TPA: lmo0937 family membrane protein [Bacillota bacterium]|nr:lmo0937 family membrane protein [Bacillota bacterium]
MSWITILLLVAWALGWVNGYTFGGLVHILLVYAMLMVTARLLQRHRPGS